MHSLLPQCLLCSEAVEVVQAVMTGVAATEPWAPALGPAGGYPTTVTPTRSARGAASTWKTWTHPAPRTKLSVSCLTPRQPRNPAGYRESVSQMIYLLCRARQWAKS